MRAIQVSRAHGAFEWVERDIPMPLDGEVLIQVEACGVCHGDSVLVDGFFPGLKYPRIPGHEVVGRIFGLGSGLSPFRLGDRVAVGWLGGHCGHCEECLLGNFLACLHPEITGITRDGGYAEYMTAQSGVVVSFPVELNSVECAPLVCAGRTSFGALKYCGAVPGDLVAIHGLGGLGHLALQYAVKMGFKTVVLSRGTVKRSLAFELGAHFYIDTSAQNMVLELEKLGGMKAIICLAPNSKEISLLIGGLANRGKLLIVTGVHDPIEINASLFLGKERSISGFSGGTIREALDFSVLTKVFPKVEVFPLEQAALAYDKMMKSEVHFRSVLKMKE
jgi:D-arabinose 1-dehydrogenase-like Zn-dependent alcohol dehydrogenase